MKHPSPQQQKPSQGEKGKKPSRERQEDFSPPMDRSNRCHEYRMNVTSHSMNMTEMIHIMSCRHEEKVTTTKKVATVDVIEY